MHINVSLIGPYSELVLMRVIGRKVAAAAPSIKVPATAWAQKRSASPSAHATVSATHQRSRLSRQIHPPARDDDDEMDADGDEEEAGEDDGDGDDRLYCYCQKQSYGDVSFMLLWFLALGLTPL